MEEENKVLKGFLIPFIVITAAVVIAAVIAGMRVYTPLPDTSGYGTFTEDGYSSSTLGLAVGGEGRLFRNSEDIETRMSPEEKSIYRQQRNIFGTVNVFECIRPFITVTVQVSTKQAWSAAQLDEAMFLEEELPDYMPLYNTDSRTLDDISCTLIDKGGVPFFYYVAEYTENGRHMAYAEARYQSDCGAVKIIAECTSADRLSEITELFGEAAEPFSDDTDG